MNKQIIYAPAETVMRLCKRRHMARAMLKDCRDAIRTLERVGLTAKEIEGLMPALMAYADASKQSVLKAARGFAVIFKQYGARQGK